jgi:soluble lytic murein transglycosylase-like protein
MQPVAWPGVGHTRRFVGALLPACLALPLVAGCSTGSQSPAQVVQVPAQYKSYFVVAAKRCPGVLTPQMLAGVAYVESRFQPDAESGNGAQGLMQILPSVFRQYGVDANGDGKKNVFTPADAVATSAIYYCVLSGLVKRFDGDQTSLLLAAYNAGIGSVTKYHGVPPFGETRDYITQVKLWTSRFAKQFAPPSPTATIS